MPKNKSAYFTSKLPLSMYFGLICTTETDTWAIKTGDILKQANNSIEIFGFASVRKQEDGTTFIVVLELKKQDDMHLKKWYFLDFDSFLKQIWTKKWSKPRNRLSDGRQLAELIKEHFSLLRTDELSRFLKPGKRKLVSRLVTMYIN